MVFHFNLNQGGFEVWQENYALQTYVFLGQKTLKIFPRNFSLM